jgi:hypothetical protein
MMGRNLVVTGYMLPAKGSTEKEFIVERAKVECCKSRFDVKKLTRMWKI